MKITRKSPYSGREATLELDITPEEWEEWNRPRHQRRLIQEIFPRLSASEREFVMTGYTQQDWDAMFPPDEED